MIVVDASVVVALVFDDPRQTAVVTAFTQWLGDGVALHAPDVLPYEVANVLARLRHDGSIDRGMTVSIWEDIGSLPIEMHPFDGDRDGVAIGDVTTQLRRRHATDSVYVWLALRLGGRMVTLDGALAHNAAASRLPVDLIG